MNNMPQTLHPAMPVIYPTGHKITKNGAPPINVLYGRETWFFTFTGHTMRGVWEETRGEYLDLQRKRREAVKVHTKYCLENQEERGAVSLTGYKQAV
jgi:hypothetical protein